MRTEKQKLKYEIKKLKIETKKLIRDFMAHPFIITGIFLQIFIIILWLYA